MNPTRMGELRKIALKEAVAQIEALDWGGVAEVHEGLTDDEVDIVYRLAMSVTVALPPPA